MLYFTICVQSKLKSLLNGVSAVSKALSKKQIDCFWENGYLTIEDAVTSSQLKKLKAEVAGWVEESRNHSEPYGQPTI